MKIDCATLALIAGAILYLVLMGLLMDNIVALIRKAHLSLHANSSSPF